MNKDFWIPGPDKSNPILETLVGRGTQEEQRSAALDHVTSYRTCLDIGSNVGFWTRELAEKFEKVICFEPNKLFISLFKRNILNDNVELHEVGLSDTKHTAYQPLYSTVMSNEPGDIICHTLDSYHINDIDFIKIDVDGFEHRVLKGAKETLIRNNEIINIELKPEKSKERKQSVRWCMNFLKECGYKHKNTIKHDEIWVKS